MTFKYFVFSAFLVLVLGAPSARAAVFDAKSATLENGMQVILVENHRAPIVTHMVWYRVGGADEQPGISGLAHMFEHMMFKGSENVPPGEFSRRVRALGGRDNAFTSYDFTAYFQTVAAEHLATVMEMEADRMRTLLLPPDEFLSERNVVIEERRQRTDNDPQAAFFEQMRYLLFPHHPYRIPIIGWMNEIEQLTVEQAREFYERWYAPNNAILIVSGAVTMEELLPLAEQYYGVLPRNPALDEPRTRPDIADFTGQLRLHKSDARIRQPFIAMMMRVPSSRQDREGALALQILGEILSGGPTTRLYRALAVEQEIASSAGLFVSNQAYDHGTAYFYVTPLPGTSLEDAEAALREQLDLLLSEGITDEELSEAKERMQAAAVFARDSVRGPAMIIGRALTTGSTLEDVETWPERVAAITKEQVMDAARTHLNPDATPLSVTGYLTGQTEPEAPATAAEEEPQE